MYNQQSQFYNGYPQMQQQQPRFTNRIPDRQMKSKTILFQKNVPSKIGDARADKYDDEGFTVDLADDNCEVIACAMDQEFLGAQGMVREGHATVGVALAHFDADVSVARMEKFMDQVPLQGTPEHFQAAMRALQEVNHRFQFFPQSVRMHLQQRKEERKNRARERLARRLGMMDGVGGPPYREERHGDFGDHGARDLGAEFDEFESDFPMEAEASGSHGPAVRVPPIKRTHNRGIDKFQHLIGLKVIDANKKSGTILSGHIGENGPYVKIKEDDGDVETEVLIENLKDFLKGCYPEDLIKVKLDAFHLMHSHLGTPGKPFVRRQRRS